VSGPLSAAEAARRILAEITRQPALRMPLDDALDGVLAEDVVSPIDIPAWINSAMDGYAVRGDDVRGASAERPIRLRVVEQIPAGAFPSRHIGPGECARIFTGAPVPDGADSVVRQEDTDEGRETVTIVKDRDVGVNLRQAGEDIRRGTKVLPAECCDRRSSGCSPRSRWPSPWCAGGPGSPFWAAATRSSMWIGPRRS
jgi:molybdopterin molybdotransferase